MSILWLTSSRVHSAYQREIHDLPLHNKQKVLLVNTRKIFCGNLDRLVTTFAERHPFVSRNGKKTHRLVSNILKTSMQVSSVNASNLLKTESVKVCKSSICILLKKIPSIMDKSKIEKICVDDFAIRKRFSYGTIMVDLETHRIIDIIQSRETSDVKKYLGISENEIPEDRKISRERQHQLAIKQKQKEVDETSELYRQGYPFEQ